MKTLNDILRWLMRKSDVVGTVYTGKKLVETVPSNTGTSTSSVTVEAGTYLIVANQEWSIESDAFAIMQLRASGGFLAIDRGDMKGGGGASVSVVATFYKNTEIVIESYHQHTVAAGIWTKLQAVRIK